MCVCLNIETHNKLSIRGQESGTVSFHGAVLLAEAKLHSEPVQLWTQGQEMMVTHDGLFSASATRWSWRSRKVKRACRSVRIWCVNCAVLPFPPCFSAMKCCVFCNVVCFLSFRAIVVFIRTNSTNKLMNKKLTVDSFSMSSSEAPSEASPISWKCSDEFILKLMHTNHRTHSTLQPGMDCN